MRENFSCKLGVRLNHVWGKDIHSMVLLELMMNNLNTTKQTLGEEKASKIHL